MKKIQPLLWSLFAAGLTLAVCLHYYSPNGTERGWSASARKYARKAALHETSLRRDADLDRSPERDSEGAEDDALARERWQIERHGFNLGVPPHAYADAMAQRRSMEAAAMAVRSRAAVPSPFWTFIGPMPMNHQKANFDDEATSHFQHAARIQGTKQIDVEIR
jgi:hypothetical protein